jgi:anti-sigma factor RsiW
MTEPAYPTDEELHAYIDHELTESRRDEVAAILRRDPALAARVAAYQADAAWLRTTLAGIAEEPVPVAWADRIETAVIAPGKTAMTRRYAMAAGVALLLSGIAVARWQWGRRDGLLAEAEAARNGRLGESLDQAQLPASRDAQLRSTLGMPVHVPDLRRFGYQLANVELFDATPTAAAQFRYSDSSQRLLTIYVRRSDGAVRFDILRHGSDRICIWQDDVVGAVIIAPVSAGEMLRIASLAYADLNL